MTEQEVRDFVAGAVHRAVTGDGEGMRHVVDEIVARWSEDVDEHRAEASANGAFIQSFYG
jgi:hypothetical protein